jgi:hypothetical protein
MNGPDPPIPPKFWERLTFEQKFQARFIFANKTRRLRIPTTFRQCVGYLSRLEYLRRISHAPANPKVGQRWLDTRTNEVKRYNGRVWEPVRSS